MRWTPLLVLVLGLSSPAGAVTFVVNSTDVRSDANPADNVCDDGGGRCSLQAAIEQATATAGLDTIEFGFQGAGPFVIRPTYLTPLTAITGDVVINGYSQPGASANTLPAGTDAQILVEIEGDGFFAGVQVYGGHVALRGLAIRGFYACVRFEPVAASVASSVLVGSVRIGGVANADRNLISNNSIGVRLGSGSNFVINN